MTELSPDARNLIEQARKQGPGVLGPSAADRARLREKLAPMWGQAPRPRPALSWKRYARLRRPLSSAALIAGFGWLCWLLFWSPEPETNEHAGAPPLTAASAAPQPPAAAEASSADTATTITTPATTTNTTTTATATPERPEAPAAAAAHAQPSHVATRKPVSANGRERARAAGEAPNGAPQTDARELTALPASAGIAMQAGPATPPAAAVAAPVQPGAPARTARAEPNPAEATPLTAAAADSSNRAVHTDSRPGPRSIEGELELLGEAQAALQAARPSRALNLLQDHAFRFPAGALIEERMAMQALALCALDRKNAAASVLSSLAARGSHSALLPRVRRQCGL